MKKRQPFIDQQYIGFLLGIMVPLITFALYYLAKYSELPFFDYLKSLHEYRLLFKIMSLCVLPDLALFYLLLQFKLLRGSRGVVMACFMFAFMVMGYRLFS